MKGTGGKLSCLLFVMLISKQLCLCQPSIRNPLHLPPSSVVVSNENGDVFIAAGTQLLRLSSTLTLLENVTVSGGGELLQIAMSPDGSKVVGCVGGESRTCLVYNSDDLTSGPSATLENAQYSSENGLAIIATNYGFYLGSESSSSTQNDNMSLGQYNYTSETVRTRDYVIVNNDFVRLFHGGITRSGYVYYFVADHNPNSIHVLRVCDCTRDACSSQFEALYELTLMCRGSISTTTRVCGVHLLESFADLNEPLVVVTQCDTASTRNRACAFLLSDIDNDMDAYFEVCRDGTTPIFQLPWEPSRRCSQFNVREYCC